MLEIVVYLGMQVENAKNEFYIVFVSCLLGQKSVIFKV